MKRKALSLALVLTLAAGCGGEASQDISSVPDPVPNDQALDLIRDCRVTLVEASHAGDFWLTLENGRRVQVAEPSGVWEAAEEFNEECPEMELATE